MCVGIVFVFAFGSIYYTRKHIVQSRVPKPEPITLYVTLNESWEPKPHPPLHLTPRHTTLQANLGRVKPPQKREDIERFIGKEIGRKRGADRTKKGKGGVKGRKGAMPRGVEVGSLPEGPRVAVYDEGRIGGS